jgi:glutathione synthase
MAEAIANPDKYVLKPQREGGGNNLYGEALKQKLQEGEGLAAYILMQRLFPPLKRLVALPTYPASCRCECVALRV